MRQRFPDADVVVFGHSHMPLHEEEDGFQLFNPGSPTQRRRAPRHTIGIAGWTRAGPLGARRARLASGRWQAKGRQASFGVQAQALVRRNPRADAESEARGASPDRGRFVVQQHDATNLHWDLRLEHEGVALSWALPRGIPQLPDRSANRLAVRTEDHPLKYLDFDGEIPAGEYGAGTMSIWDSGTYEAEKLRDDEVIATFDGERLRAATRCSSTRGKNWIIHRMDPPLDPERQPIPDELKPMQPRRGEMPPSRTSGASRSPGAGCGRCCGASRATSAARAAAASSRETVDSVSRSCGGSRARSVPPRPCSTASWWCLTTDGGPSAERLRERKRGDSDSVARRLARDKPATLMLFDLLFCDGRDSTDLPYEERRERLEGLELDGGAWQTPSWHRGDGAAAARGRRGRAGCAGLMAKRLGSPYLPGRSGRRLGQGGGMSAAAQAADQAAAGDDPQAAPARERSGPTSRSSTASARSSSSTATSPTSSRAGQVAVAATSRSSLLRPAATSSTASW